MVKIHENRHTKLFATVVVILAILGSIFFGHMFSASDSVSFSLLSVPAFAAEEEDEPDEEMNVTFAYLTMRATNYVNRFLANEDESAQSLLSYGYWSDENVGGLIGYSDGEPDGDKKGGIFGLFSILDTQATTGYSTKQLARMGNNGDTGAGLYYSMGYKLKLLGYDETGNNSMKITRVIGGALMLVAVIAAMCVRYIFDILFTILDFTNPFRFFSEASTFNGMQQSFASSNGLDRIIEYFSKTYDSFADFAFSVVIPFTFTVFLVGFFLSRAYRNNAMHHLRQFLIRAAFIIVGIPLVGSLYTQMLTTMGNSFSINGSFVSNVIASTFVDMRSVIEANKGLPLFTDLLSTQNIGTDVVVTGTEWTTIRSNAQAINSKGGWVLSGDETFSTSDTNSFTTNDFNATNNTGGSNAASAEDVDRAYDTVLRYLTCDQYSAAQYESYAKGEYGNTVELGKYLATLTYKYSFNQGSTVHNVTLPESIKSGGGETNINGAAYSSANTGVTYSSFPFFDGDDTRFSTVATYNYLSSKFSSAGITVYSPNAPTPFTKEQHFSVTMVGGDLLMKFVLGVNALVMLFAYFILACNFVFYTAVDAIFYGFDVMAEALFASLGMYKAIARCISAACCILAEVFVALLFFSITTELMYAISFVVDTATTNANVGSYSSGANSGGRMLVTVSVLLATIIQFFFVRFCMKWRSRIVKAFQDNIREIIEAVMGVRMGAGAMAGDTAGAMAGADAKKLGGAGKNLALGALAGAAAGKAGSEMQAAQAEKAAMEEEAANKRANEVEPQGAGAEDAANANASESSSSVDTSASLNQAEESAENEDKATAEQVGDSVADSHGGSSTAAGQNSTASGSDSQTETETETSEEAGESSSDGENTADGEADNAIINGDAIVTGGIQGAESNAEGGEGGAAGADGDSADGSDGDSETNEHLSDNIRNAEADAREKAAQAEMVAKQNERADYRRAAADALFNNEDGGIFNPDNFTHSGAQAAAAGAAGAMLSMDDARKQHRDEKAAESQGDAMNEAEAQRQEAIQNLNNAKAAAEGKTEKHTYRDPETGELTTVETDPMTGNTTETTTDADGNTTTTSTKYGEMDPKTGERPIVASMKTTTNAETGEMHSEATTYDEKGNVTGTATADVDANGVRTEEQRDKNGNVVSSSKTDANGHTLESFNKDKEGNTETFKADVDDDGNAVVGENGAVAGVRSTTDAHGRNTTEVTNADGSSVSVTGDTHKHGGDKGQNKSLAYDKDGNVKRDENGQVLDKDGNAITSAADFKGASAATITNADGTGSSVTRDKHGNETMRSETSLKRDKDGNVVMGEDGNPETQTTTTTASYKPMASDKGGIAGLAENAKNGIVTGAAVAAAKLPGVNMKPENQTITQTESDGSSISATFDGAAPSGARVSVDPNTGRPKITDANGREIKDAKLAAWSATDANGNKTESMSKKLADGSAVSVSRVTSSDGKSMTETETMTGADGSAATRTVDTKLNNDGTVASQTTTTESKTADGKVTKSVSSMDAKTGSTTTTVTAPDGQIQETVTNGTNGVTATAIYASQADKDANRPSSVVATSTNQKTGAQTTRSIDSKGAEHSTTTMPDGTVTTVDVTAAKDKQVTRISKPDGSEEVIEQNLGADGKATGGTKTTTIPDGKGGSVSTTQAVDANGKPDVYSSQPTVTTRTDDKGNRFVQVSSDGGNNTASYAVTSDGKLQSFTNDGKMGAMNNETTTRLAAMGVNVSQDAVTGKVTESGAGMNRTTSRDAATGIVTTTASYGGAASVATTRNAEGEVTNKTVTNATSTVGGTQTQTTTTYNTNDKGEAKAESTNVDGSTTTVTGSERAVATNSGARDVTTENGFNGARMTESFNRNGRTSMSGQTAAGDTIEQTSFKNGAGNIELRNAAGGRQTVSYASGGQVSGMTYENAAAGTSDKSTFDAVGRVTSREMTGVNGVKTSYNASYDGSGRMMSSSVAVRDEARGVSSSSSVNQYGAVTQSMKDTSRGISQTTTQGRNGTVTTRTMDINTGEVFQTTTNAQQGITTQSRRTGGTIVAGQPVGGRTVSYTQDAAGNVSMSEIKHSVTGPTVQTTRMTAEGAAQMQRTNLSTGQFEHVSVGANGSTNVVRGNNQVGSASQMSVDVSTGAVASRSVNAAGGYTESGRTVSPAQAQAMGQRYTAQAGNVMADAVQMSPGMAQRAAGTAQAAAAMAAGAAVVQAANVTIQGASVNMQNANAAAAARVGGAVTSGGNMMTQQAVRQMSAPSVNPSVMQQSAMSARMSGGNVMSGASGGGNVVNNITNNYGVQGSNNAGGQAAMRTAGATAANAAINNVNAGGGSRIGGIAKTGDAYTARMFNSGPQAGQIASATTKNVSRIAAPVVNTAGSVRDKIHDKMHNSTLGRQSTVASLSEAGRQHRMEAMRGDRSFDTSVGDAYKSQRTQERIMAMSAASTYSGQSISQGGQRRYFQSDDIMHGGAPGSGVTRDEVQRMINNDRIAHQHERMMPPPPPNNP